MLEREQYGSRFPSEREQRLIALVAQGLKNHEVAAILGTTEHVVKNYLRAIYDKLGLWNRVELALWHEARQHGVANLGPSPKLTLTVDSKRGTKTAKWKHPSARPLPGEEFDPVN